MIYLIGLIGIIFVVYLVAKNSNLENDNWNLELEKVRKEVYDEYKRKHRKTLLKEFDAISKDYDTLLKVAIKRYEKDPSPQEYQKDIRIDLGFVDEVKKDRAEIPRYMATNEEEMYLYYKYQILKDLIEQKTE